jgi:hypothetical protein
MNNATEVIATLTELLQTKDSKSVEEGIQLGKDYLQKAKAEEEKYHPIYFSIDADLLIEAVSFLDPSLYFKGDLENVLELKERIDQRMKEAYGLRRLGKDEDPLDYCFTFCNYVK